MEIIQKRAHGVNETNRSCKIDVVSTAGISVHTWCQKLFTERCYGRQAV